jgi:hypothetical protein
MSQQSRSKDDNNDKIGGSDGSLENNKNLKVNKAEFEVDLFV